MSNNNKFTRISNTVVSGSSVISSLDPVNYRAIANSASLANPNPVNLVIGDSTNKTLSPEQWNQAIISSQAVNMATGGSISLGADTASQAASYLSLFNFSSTDQQRLLRFYVSNADTNAPNRVLLQNSGSTNTFVAVTTATGPAASATYSTTLFGTGAGAGVFPTGNGQGIERLVSVIPKNLSAGSQSVQFNILPYSM